jgi:hypothetical protein
MNIIDLNGHDADIDLDEYTDDINREAAPQIRHDSTTIFPKATSANPKRPYYHTSIPTAQTEDDILSDYPFFGVLHRIDTETDRAVFLDTIPPERPVRLSQIARQNKLRKGGEFLLKTYDPDGNRIEISFFLDRLEESSKTTSVISNGQSAAEVESLRVRIKDELRSDYDARINLLQQDVQSFITRNNEQQQRISELTRQLADDKVTLIQSYNQQINDLRGLLSQAQQDVAIAKLKNELSGIDDDAGEGEDEMPAWVNTLTRFAPLVEKFVTGMQNGQQPAMIADATQVAAEAMEVRPNDQSQPTPDEIMQSAVQDFANSIIHTAIKAMLSKANPNGQAINDFVTKQLNILAQQGARPTAKDWLLIANHVATEAVNQNVQPERVAQVIEPLLSKLETAKTILKYMPSKEAASMLYGTFGIQPPDPVNALIVNVLDYYKTKI